MNQVRNMARIIRKPETPTTMPIIVPVFAEEEAPEAMGVADALGSDVEELMAEVVGAGVMEELGVGEGIDMEGCGEDESSDEVVEDSGVEVVFDEASSVEVEDSADDVIFSVEDESSESDDVEGLSLEKEDSEDLLEEECDELPELLLMVLVAVPEVSVLVIVVSVVVVIFSVISPTPVVHPVAGVRAVNLSDEKINDMLRWPDLLRCSSDM